MYIIHHMCGSVCALSMHKIEHGFDSIYARIQCKNCLIDWLNCIHDQQHIDFRSMNQFRSRIQCMHTCCEKETTTHRDGRIVWPLCKLKPEFIAAYFYL